MDKLANSTTCQFDDFLVDLRARALFRLDTTPVPARVQLGSRAFDILCVLIERRNTFVSKQEMLDVIWPGVVVEENNLTVQMSALRRVLDAGRTRGSCIQTVPGRGYRFLPQVTDLADTTTTIANSDAGPLPPANGPAVEGANLASTPHLVSPRRKPGAAVWTILLGVLVVVLVALLSWYIAGSRVATTKRPRLSIVVLPFENLSGNPAEDYLAEGITDDLTSDLAHVPNAFVIARESAYTYRDKPENVQRIGEQLNVRYVLEGSVRLFGPTLRVNAQLNSTETGAQLWSDRFDEQVIELATGQAEVVRRIGTALDIKMVEIEGARSARERPTKPDAFDLVLRARSLRNGSRSQARNDQAQALYERALQLDSASVPAMLGIAGILIDRNLATLGQWTIADDVVRAARLIAAAEAIQPNSEDVLVAVAELMQAQEHWTDLAFTAQRIIELYPNRVEGYELLGMAKRFVGTVEESVQLYDESIRLNPLESNLFYRCSCMGYALLLVGRYDEAIIWFERSLAANPGASGASRGARYRSIAAAHALSGRLDAAREALRKADHLSPYATARIFFPDNPHNSAEVAQIRRIIDALRVAGLPDHAEEDTNFQVQNDDRLRRDLAGPTPTKVSDAQTIRTVDLVPFLTERKPIVIDTALYSWGRSIPGAVGLKSAGLGGNFFDTAQDHLRRKMQDLTKGNLAVPIVAVGWNSQRFDGYNLALRLVALGYTNVHWYRGGRESWEVAGLPETELVVQDW